MIFVDITCKTRHRQVTVSVEKTAQRARKVDRWWTVSVLFEILSVVVQGAPIDTAAASVSVPIAAAGAGTAAAGSAASRG